MRESWTAEEKNQGVTADENKRATELEGIRSGGSVPDGVKRKRQREVRQLRRRQRILIEREV